MAKALVNRGVSIKADNPKDPYIRDENGIKDIVDSSKVFGKTLGTSNGKIQLKNGNTVLSEVTMPAPDLSAYGKTLAISGQDLSLKNGNTILSTVTIPSSGGGGGGNIDIVVGRFVASTDEFIVNINKGTLSTGKLIIIEPPANLSAAYILSDTYNCKSATSGIKLVPTLGSRQSSNSLNVTKWSVTQTLFGYIYDHADGAYWVKILGYSGSYDKYADNSSYVTDLSKARNLIVNSNAVVTENTTDKAFIFYYNDTEYTPVSTTFITTLDGKFFYIAEFTGQIFINKVYYGYTNSRKFRPTYFCSYPYSVDNPKVMGTLEYDYTNKVFNLDGLPVGDSRLTSHILIIEGPLWTK